MKHLISAIVFLLLLQPIYSFQLEKHPTDRIKELSSSLGKALEKESLQGTLFVFDDNATLLPEYHASLTGRSQISEYYTQFFWKTETHKYERKPFEIEKVYDMYVELGTFEHQYTTPLDSLFNYRGKYLSCWKLQKDGTPRIIAHIWGASHYFDAEHLDFIQIATSDVEVISPGTQWEKDIEEVRRFVYEAVLNGNAEKQLTSYAEDAVYMTYYDPPFIGKQQITEYFTTHYNPEVTRDSLLTRAVKVIDLGDHALKFGEYHVEWMYDNQPYFIKGKGLSLYRRKDDGEVEIYRQMINHSMPASPKK